MGTDRAKQARWPATRLASRRALRAGVAVRNWCRGAVVAFVVAAVLLLANAPAVARSQDACPEPNDTFQGACALGAALSATGFISGPEDVDAYRVVVLDMNAQLHAEVADGPYALQLYDWNGTVIAQALTGGADLDATVPMPGSYYLGVASADGSFSESVPYRLGVRLTYPQSTAPAVHFSDDLSTAVVGDWAHTSQYAIFSVEGSRFTIDVREDGIAQEWERVASRPFGPELGNFTATMDARASNQVDGESHVGYRLGFRWRGPYEQYSLVVDTTSGRAWLNLVNGDSMKATKPLTDERRVRSIARDGGVNRTVIRATGDDVHIWINGEEAHHVRDATLGRGRFNLVAAGWSRAKPLVRFDNVLITSP